MIKILEDIQQKYNYKIEFEYIFDNFDDDTDTEIDIDETSLEQLLNESTILNTLNEFFKDEPYKLTFIINNGDGSIYLSTDSKIHNEQEFTIDLLEFIKDMTEITMSVERTGE